MKLSEEICNSALYTDGKINRCTKPAVFLCDCHASGEPDRFQFHFMCWDHTYFGKLGESMCRECLYLFPATHTPFYELNEPQRPNVTELQWDKIYDARVDNLCLELSQKL